jgi:hypothetical protein
LKSAKEIIGERTAGEKAYDDEVIAGLDRGLPIRAALRAANEKFPDEALQVDSTSIPDVKAHYDYLAEHKRILRRLGMNE